MMQKKITKSTVYVNKDLLVKILPESHYKMNCLKTIRDWYHREMSEITEKDTLYTVILTDGTEETVLCKSV